MNRYYSGRSRSGRLLAAFSVLLCLILPVGQAGAQSFSDEMGAGLDNTQFTYELYQDGTSAIPTLIADSTAVGGDSIQLGPITESTASISRETGFFFDFQGPGTLTLRWKVSSEPFNSTLGKGTLLWLQMFDPTTGAGYTQQFISGVQDWADVVVEVPDAPRRVLLSYVRTAGSTAQNLDRGWMDNLRWEPAGGDTTPDPFAFEGQSNVARSSAMTSNSIVIRGIDAPTPISIESCSGTNCGYSVNGGAFTAAAGTVQNGDTIVVRQTSSVSYQTLTSLNLNVGGFTAAFNVQTLNPYIFGSETPTGSGNAQATFRFSIDSGSECAITEAALLNAPVAPPPGVDLPHGLLGFTASGCASSFSVNVTVEYPDPIPAGASYWKYSGEGWYTIPATISGNQVSFTIIDNGLGDSNSALGTITDPGGIGVSGTTPPPNGGEAAAIPTLSQWALILLAAALGLLALAGLRRRVTG